MHPFDLQARAALAARSLTSLLDPRQDGLMFFLASWRAKPPQALHGLWDYGDGSGRHTDALTLARRMLPAGWAEASPDAGEKQIEAWMLRCLGEDGLSWLPQVPWTAAPWGAEQLLRDWQAGEAFAEISWAQRGTLLGLTARWQASQDERYLAAGCRLVDGLLRAAERDGQDLFFPEGYYRPGGWRWTQPGIQSGIAEYNAAVIVPALRFYAATGYEPAFRLAEGLARFTLRRGDGYRPDGSLYCPEPGSLVEHFHTRGNFILGVLELGLLSGRREYIAWARQSYERALAFGTRFGWFPEGLSCRHGEICCTTDMLEIALNLGRWVDPAYYAHAERYGRNHLLESQFLSLDALSAAVDGLPEETLDAEELASTNQGVLQSQVGGFAARSTLNDAFHLDATAQMQCCNAAGTRGIYDLWRYALQRSPGQDGLPRLDVNLRFSVESEDLRAVSHEPTQGRLDLLPAIDCQIRVRLPEGETRAVLSDSQGARSDLPAEHGYAVFPGLAGQPLQLSYALALRDETFRVGPPEKSLECSGRWRGETLVAIEPRGQYLPLYAGREADLPPALPARPARPLLDSLAALP